MLDCDFAGHSIRMSWVLCITPFGLMSHAGYCIRSEQPTPNQMQIRNYPLFPLSLPHLYHPFNLFLFPSFFPSQFLSSPPFCAFGVIACYHHRKPCRRHNVTLAAKKWHFLERKMLQKGTFMKYDLS